MDPIRAVVYGIVQGLTEFLPVSSNAHLRLTPLLFGWNEPAEQFTAFTAVIQLGTTLAVLLYFAKDLRRVLAGWLREFGAGPLPVTPLPIQAVAPGAAVDGPDPQLAEQVRELHRRHRAGR